MSVQYLLTRPKDRGRAVDESLTNDMCIDIRSMKLCHLNMSPSYCEKCKRKRLSTQQLWRHLTITNLASRPAVILRPYIQQERRPPTGKERTAARKTYLHACAQVSEDIPRGQDWCRRPEGNFVFVREARNSEREIMKERQMSDKIC